MEEFEKVINYTFKDKELLKVALTHSSYANEHKKQHLKYNERLEFLGEQYFQFPSLIIFLTIVHNYLRVTLQS